MITRLITPRTLIYAAAVAVLFIGILIGNSTMVRAQSGGTWASCTLYWFGMMIGPAECGSPPPGSECTASCSGSFPGFCPTDYCWSVFIPDPPPSCTTVGQSCTSPSANSCAMYGSGTIDSNCNCTASTPSDALCPAPTCSNGSSGPYPGCPLPSCSDFGQIGTYPFCSDPPSCTPDTSCAASTCNTSTCTATASDCSTYQIAGTNAGACGPSPAVSCSVSPSGVSTLPGSVTYSANPSNGASGAYTWDDSQSGSYGSSATQVRNWSSGATAGSYVMRVKGSNTSWSTCPAVSVSSGSGSCTGAGPLTATATPNRIDDSTAVVSITWSSPDVDGACTLTNLAAPSTSLGNSTATSCSTSGSANVSGITAQTTYRVTCGSLTKDVVVNVVPRYEEF